MWGLAQFLRSQSYVPHFFGYWAWKHSYDQIVAELRSQLLILSGQGDYSIIAHSLGGVLCRSALQNWPHAMPHHLVMLGTPNQRPRLATMAHRIPIYQWVTQDCGQNLSRPSFYAKLPSLTCPYTIIAGTAGPRGQLSPFGTDPNDGVVAVAETRIEEGDRLLKFPVFHTFMMNDAKIQDTIIQYLNFR